MVKRYISESAFVEFDFLVAHRLFNDLAEDLGSLCYNMCAPLTEKANMGRICNIDIMMCLCCIEGGLVFFSQKSL